jgi:hypothetical protein
MVDWRARTCLTSFVSQTRYGAVERYTAALDRSVIRNSGWIVAGTERVRTRLGARQYLVRE